MVNLLNHNVSTFIISMITLMVLYLDDIRIIFLNKGEDKSVDFILVFCMVVFIIELLISSYSMPGYLWSFFFWLDLISCLSMPMDIEFVVEYFSGEADNLIFQTDDASNVARVGRASRVGTRAGRYIKLVKLIKIVKVGKFFA